MFCDITNGLYLAEVNLDLIFHCTHTENGLRSEWKVFFCVK